MDGRGAEKRQVRREPAFFRRGLGASGLLLPPRRRLPERPRHGCRQGRAAQEPDRLDARGGEACGRALLGVSRNTKVPLRQILRFGDGPFQDLPHGDCGMFRPRTGGRMRRRLPPANPRWPASFWPRNWSWRGSRQRRLTAGPYPTFTLSECRASMPVLPKKAPGVLVRRPGVPPRL